MPYYPLALKYEAACSDPARAASGLTGDDVRVVVDALCAVAHAQRRDPADEMVLETAINGRSDALVTFTRRDYRDAPNRFGIARHC